MYFESNRSSRDGMVAVGSVVMNRVESNRYPDSVCAVVRQRGQFAPGIMTKRMKDKTNVREAANAVLHGERHPLVGNAMFFHTANRSYSYDNMNYVLTAGGNAFYERVPSAQVTQAAPLPPLEGLTGR